MDLAPNGRSKPPVKLSGRYGEVYVLGVTMKALRDAGWAKDERDEYLREAKSGDYDHLLQTTMRYCDVS